MSNSDFIMEAPEDFNPKKNFVEYLLKNLPYVFASFFGGILGGFIVWHIYIILYNTVNMIKKTFDRKFGTDQNYKMTQMALTMSFTEGNPIFSPSLVSNINENNSQSYFPNDILNSGYAQGKELLRKNRQNTSIDSQGTFENLEIENQNSNPRRMNTDRSLKNQEGVNHNPTPENQDNDAFTNQNDTAVFDEKLATFRRRLKNSGTLLKVARTNSVSWIDNYDREDVVNVSGAGR